MGLPLIQIPPAFFSTISGVNSIDLIPESSGSRASTEAERERESYTGFLSQETTLKNSSERKEGTPREWFMALPLLAGRLYRIWKSGAAWFMIFQLLFIICYRSLHSTQSLREIRCDVIFASGTRENVSAFSLPVSKSHPSSDTHVRNFYKMIERTKKKNGKRICNEISHAVINSGRRRRIEAERDAS